jgi:hypothetical protein
VGLVVGPLEDDMGADSEGAKRQAVRAMSSISGPILAAVMAAEIDGIGRFPRADKLCAYAACPASTASKNRELPKQPSPAKRNNSVES